MHAEQNYDDDTTDAGVGYDSRTGATDYDCAHYDCAGANNHAGTGDDNDAGANNDAGTRVGDHTAAASRGLQNWGLVGLVRV